MSAPPSSSGGKVEKHCMNCRPLDLRCKTNALALKTCIRGGKRRKYDEERTKREMIILSIYYLEILFNCKIRILVF
jgi:hypothetical protein